MMELFFKLLKNYTFSLLQDVRSSKFESFCRRPLIKMRCVRCAVIQVARVPLIAAADRQTGADRATTTAALRTRLCPVPSRRITTLLIPGKVAFCCAATVFSRLIARVFIHPLAALGEEASPKPASPKARFFRNIFSERLSVCRLSVDFDSFYDLIMQSVH